MLLADLLVLLTLEINHFSVEESRPVHMLVQFLLRLSQLFHRGVHCLLLPLRYFLFVAVALRFMRDFLDLARTLRR